MNWINDTIRDFGISIGIPDLALDNRGKLDLDLPNNARLRISSLTNLPLPEVLVSRSESIFYPSYEILAELLKLNDFRNASEWPIQTSISERELWISMRIPERSFVVNVLEQALSNLKKIHEILNTS